MVITYNEIMGFYQQLGVKFSYLQKNSITSEECDMITNIVRSLDFKSFLEVGTSLGVSTAVIAASMPLGGRLISVDPNLPLETWATESGHQIPVLDLTREMLVHFQLAEHVVVLEGYFSCPPTDNQLIHLESKGLTTYPERRVIGDEISTWAPYDLIFIDGEHFTEAVFSDLCIINKYISPHGIIILHDVDYSWGVSVRAAINNFLSEYNDYQFDVQKNLGLLRHIL